MTYVFSTEEHAYECCAEGCKAKSNTAVMTMVSGRPMMSCEECGSTELIENNVDDGVDVEGLATFTAEQ